MGVVLDRREKDPKIRLLWKAGSRIIGVVRELYDSIGRTYRSTRQPDPRIAAAIRSGIGPVETLLNVGAGAGSYEPEDVVVTAVEPSEVMIAQRPAGPAAVVRASAEDLPFADDSFDVACAILSDHHWTDRRRGLQELLRVARRRVVLFNADPCEFDLFWMNREYLHAFGGYLLPPGYERPGFWRQELTNLLGTVQFFPVPIPHDCIDGFYGAYWGRPPTRISIQWCEMESPCSRSCRSRRSRMPPRGSALTSLMGYGTSAIMIYSHVTRCISAIT